MRIIKDKKNKNLFKVESSEGAKFYTVDIQKRTCTCMHFLLRLKNTGRVCKHINAVIQKYCQGYNNKKKNAIIEYVKKKKEVDSIELIEKFGEDEVDKAIKEGILIEEKGKIRILK